MRAPFGVCVLLGALLIGCGESTTRTVASAAGAGGNVSQVDPVNTPVTEPTQPPSNGGNSGNGGSAGYGGSAGGVGGSGVSGSAGNDYGGVAGNVPDEPKLWEMKRAALLKVIGRPQVPLDTRETPKGQDGALRVEDFSIQSDASTRINGSKADMIRRPLSKLPSRVQAL